MKTQEGKEKEILKRKGRKIVKNPKKTSTKRG